jgi:2-polyprenyl-3-methyl-5-hydroxy-6-metoxy-1,4-benzoquinol methylase
LPGAVLRTLLILPEVPSLSSQRETGLDSSLNIRQVGYNENFGKGGSVATHVCPWWLGYLLINPLRRLWQNPEGILGDYVRPGMTVLDIGPGMGYFSLWMAKAVTETGRVVCVDVQEKMIRSLTRRAARAGLEGWIDVRVCSESSLGIDDLAQQVDFALVFAVVHEVADTPSLFVQIKRVLKLGGTCLLAEPKGHVTCSEFDKAVGIAADVGLEVIDRPPVWRSRTALLGVRKHT